MIRRALATGFTVAAVSTVLGFAAPAASAQDCQALQNTYAAASAAALKRAGELQISDEDFRVLRDELQKLGSDGELTSQELVPLTLRNEAARKLSLNFTEADQALIQRLIKAYNTFQKSCNGDPDAGTSTDVPNNGAGTATTSARATASASASASAAPTSTARAARPSSGGQVVAVPNDAPETGDGSTEVYVTPEAVTAQVAAYLALSSVAGVGVFVALRRSQGR